MEKRVWAGAGGLKESGTPRVPEQAVLLVGGLGTRLGELSRSTPKPLLPVGGVPLLGHLLWNFRRFGVERFLFCVGHLAEKVFEHFGDGSRFGVKIDYAFERAPAGTGGALALVADRLEDLFFVANGDTIFDLNYLDLALALGDGALAGLALRAVPEAGRYGSVCLKAGRVTGFAEKGVAGAGLISGGVYVMRREALDFLPTGPCSLERDLFPQLATRGRLAGKSYRGFFIDIGLPESLHEADTLVPRWRQKPAVFFDRDGVLNVDHGYVHSECRFEWVEGAPEAIKWANDEGYLVIVVTNQAGIARGLYTEDQFASFTAWLNRELRARGAHIDATYFCPHHPTEGNPPYLAACGCRKPEPGMIRRAVTEWDIDVERSVIIGDKDSDLKAGQAVGVRGALFNEDNLLRFVQRVVPPSVES